MSPWIAMRYDLITDPAVIAISVACKLPRPYVVGCLHEVWCWFDNNTTDGTAAIPVDLIDELAQVKGFAAAMQAAGWLVITAKRMKIPHFSRHMSQCTKRRALAAARTAKYRERLRDADVTLERHKNVTQASPQEQEQEQNKEEYPPTPQGGMIERIYESYPRKVGKGQALKAIAKAIKAIAGRADVSDPAAWLLERVQAFAASPAGQAGKFTPYPGAWFNAARYDDDPAEWNREDQPRKDNTHGKLTSSADPDARYRDLAAKV
jgi:hypothetical protein